MNQERAKSAKAYATLLNQKEIHDAGGNILSIMNINKSIFQNSKYMRANTKNSLNQSYFQES